VSLQSLFAAGLLALSVPGLAAGASSDRATAHPRSPAAVHPKGATGGALPPGWADTDIGSPAIPGSASFAAGTFTVNASGADIENTADAFHYVYQQVAGDVTVIARVASIQNTDPWAKGGVMIRETLAADSRHAMTVVTPGNGVVFQRRQTTGGSTDTTQGPLVAAPYWVKIVRTGDNIVGYSSADGVVWDEVGEHSVPMAAAVFVGLPLTGHNDTVLNTSTFDNVSVTGGSCTPGDLIVDGGFEATDPGTLTNPNWATGSTQFGTPLCGTGLCGNRTGTATPRTGTFWGWFGGTAGVASESAFVAQGVTFPSGSDSVTLDFYMWISAVTAPFTDTLEVQVDGVTQATFTEPDVAEGGYSLHTVDLSAFANGVPHSISFFYNQPAGGGTSSFNVDDVSLTVVCGGGVTIFPFSLTVDPAIGLGVPNNGVFEMNETAVIVAPGWVNDGAAPVALTGTAANLSGGVGTISTIDDSTADYGLIPAGGHADCVSATGDCYAMTVTGDRSLQPVHFDVTFTETVIPLAPEKTWTLHVGESFGDVSNDTATNPFYPKIETILHKGVTGGCAAGPPALFCPTQNVLRREMAPFLLKAHVGADYAPPACTGIFTDVPCPATPDFPYSDFIEDLNTRGITGGCAVGPPALYCPDDPVTRAQMAPFLLKTLLGGGYVPPDCAGVFTDVPCPATPEFPYSNFVEDLKTRGITAGCQVGPPALYCPDDPITREQMAAFLTLTFGLVLYGP
jgi:hypothetical protein